MSLFNAGWIGLDGAPITGKVPTKIVVHADGEMRLPESHRGAVAHAYKLFCDAVTGSAFPGGFHAQNRVLQDGTKIRMTSIASVHQVHVWPVEGASKEDFGIFVGVPSSMAHPTGYANPEWSQPLPGPTGIWDGYIRTKMPAELDPGREIADHPGHITWSSRFFRKSGQEIQVSWRGADSRYSESTGWSVSGGGVTRPYEMESIYVGNNSVPFYIGSVYGLYSGTSSVWIDGKRVYTGIRKVIAAALHRPEPAMRPEHVVVRVCTDNYPNWSSTRGVAVYDLVAPGVVAEDCTLADIMAAVTSEAAPLVVKGAYPAEAFRTASPAAGQWMHRQHPHFDSLGARMVTTIEERDVRGEIGVVGAVFSLPSWEIVQRVNLPTSSNYSSSTTYEGTFGPQVYWEYYLPNGQGFGYSYQVLDYASVVSVITHSKINTSIIAIDFIPPENKANPDDVVYLYATVNYSLNSNYSSSTGWPSHSSTANLSRVTNESMTITHSKHGEVGSCSRSTNRAASGGAAQGNGSISDVSDATEYFKIAFVGDLNRDVFAIGSTGVAKKLDAVSLSGSIASWDEYSAATAQIPIHFNNAKIKSDIYFGGVKTVSQVEAGYVDAYSIFGYDAFAAGSISFDAAWLFNSSFVPPADIIQSNWTSQHGSSAWAAGIMCQRERFGHMAVDSKRKVAYFGVDHYHGSVNLVLRNVAPNSPAAAQVAPAHAPGDKPTLAAPVFLGKTRFYP